MTVATHTHTNTCQHKHEHSHDCSKHKHVNSHDESKHLKPENSKTKETKSHNCASCHDHKHHHPKEEAEKLVKMHEKSGHSCSDPSCSIQEPHGHIHHEDELSESFNKFIKDFLPLEKPLEKIKNASAKQFLINLSHLSPASLVASLSESLGINSFIAAPLSMSSMHLVNRGTKKLKNLGFMSLLSLAAVSMQKFLPKWLVRSAVGLPIYMMESKDSSNSKDFTQKLLKRLLSFEAQIVSVPAIVDLVVDKCFNSFKAENGLAKTILNSFKLISRILGLSLGFTASSQLIGKLSKNPEDKALSQSNAVATACPCCGSPGVCISEVVSSSMVQ